jgi:hypothetical protein
VKCPLEEGEHGIKRHHGVALVRRGGHWARTIVAPRQALDRKPQRLRPDNAGTVPPGTRASVKRTHLDSDLLTP